MSEKTWKVKNLQTFLEAPVPETPWLITGFVPSEALVLVSGQQKRAHKSWLANTIGAIMCSGKAWGGLVPTTKGPVLHIQMEGTPLGNRNLITALHNAVGTTQEDRTKRYFYIFRENVKLDDGTWQKRIQSVMEQVKPIIVIFDCMVYLHNADENKVQEVKPVIDTIQAIRAHGATCLLVAHLNSSGENPKEDIDNQVRGRGLWVNAYDGHLALRRYTTKQKIIDLTVRLRDLGAETKYKVQWDIKSEYEEIESVQLNITKEGEIDLDEKLELLKPNMRYLRKELQTIWNVPEDTLIDLLEQALASQKLERAGLSYVKPSK